MRIKYLFVILCLIFYAAASAQQHGLDPSFNDSGIVIPNIANQITASSQLYDVCLQPDGKIITTGYGTGMRAMRFNPNGKPDSSFAINGMFTYSIGGGICTLSPNSNILIAGTIGSNTFGVLKLKTNGILDSSFGTNGLAYQFGGNYGVTGIAVQSDNRIVVSGTAGDNFVMVRFLANGTPDSSFGVNGRVITFGGYNLTQCNSIALQPDGKILLAGSGAPNSFASLLVIRYNLDGSIDSSFNYTGRVEWQPNEAAAHTVKIQPDGKILVSGGAFTQQYQQGAEVVMRINTNGTFDTTFNHNGILLVPHSGYSPLLFGFGCHMALLPDGRIVFGGVVEDTIPFSNRKYATLSRCMANGRPDSSFCINGSQVLTISQPGSGIYNLAIQMDGKVIAAGFCNWIGGNQYSKMTLARFIPDGNVGIPETVKPQPDVSIYPNPANNFFTIETSKPILSVRLTGIDGKTYKRIDKPTANTQFTTQDLPNGTYFVLITISGHASLAKAITILH